MVAVPNSFCGPQFLSPYSNSSCCLWGSSFSNRGDVSPFLLKLPSFRPQAAPGGRGLRVLSCLRRHPKRRNSLREKLLARQNQVRKVLEVTAPNLRQGNAQPGLNLQTQREYSESNTIAADTRPIHGGFPLALNQDGTNDAKAEVDLGKRELISSKSVLWNTLENWVEQHKKDSEFWGIGSVPIFTVYKDSDGNVIRVSLNEDEIIRRSQVETWSLQPKEFRDDFMDVNAKISRARIIAKEIESGEYKLSKNTTIAKIVVEGSKSSYFIDRLHSLNFGGKTRLKFSPQMVFPVLFSCFVFWSMKRLVVTNDGMELTKEEKEMLRRKLTSRMGGDKVEKGSVEVLKNIPELPVGFDQRPSLDKNELMKAIKAKSSIEGSITSNLGNHFNVNDENFRDHVREIREMVKQVHELERADQEQVEKRGSESDAEDKLQVTKSNANLETHSTVNGSYYIDVPDNSIVAEDTEIMNFAGVKDSTVGSPSNIPCGVSRKTTSHNGFIESETMDNPVRETVGSVNEMPAKVSADHSNSEDSFRDLDLDVLKNKETELAQGSNKGKNIDSSVMRDGERTEFDLTCSDKPSSVGKNSIRKKPKIIVSVKEAREYLGRRYTSSIDKLQSNPKTQGIREPVGLLADESPNSINERMEAVRHPNLDVTVCAKDNNLACGSHSHVVLDHLLNATDQKNIDEPSCTTAITGLSSMDVETCETECPDGTSLDHVEDKVLQTEAITSVVQFFKEEEVAKLEGTDYARNLCKPDSSDVRDEEQHSLEQEVKGPKVCNDVNDVTIRALNHEDSCTATGRNKLLAHSSSELTPVPTSMVKLSADLEMEEDNDDVDSKILHKANESVNLRPSASHDEAALQGGGLERKHGTNSLPDPYAEFSLESNDVDCHTEVKQVQGEKSWVEKNLQQFDPIIQKIGVGFRENYMAAREKRQEQKMISAKVDEMSLEDEELEWMNDDTLREIVLKVRENELAGREPFHLMDVDEQSTFFKGLEWKAEKENKRLSALHELIHSKIENIDYGMDGISLDDPLDKIMPRWKGPPISEDPKFLNNFVKHQQVIFESKMEKSPTTGDTQGNLQKSDSDTLPPSSPNHSMGKLSRDSDSNPKTVIECSDGSSRAGKMLGKEHWEHTKKWSREFLELYNTETDPEIKSIMRDMGKDLDKWITEKEIQDVADLMTRIPKRKRRYIEKKLDKLKRQIEMFGHQAVVSKYREYSEEKEEDHLWWLDLSFILCIELYRIEDDVPKIGFYSLEMAEDLELNPKQHHVIAFKDAGDSKNFCYIIQAHLDMLGNGSAFVVARPPKDAFREAKANGFNVTVLRKGELKLNIDLTLEEVEEEIIEIGSKMYHDKIMRERSIDMGALMKGVFSADKSSKRKSKRVPKKPIVR
uniref:Uncharacterized protein n=1 Tax=Anthurium amnicola TaxID=1678845 RepID=A0A1D1YAW1_9ARAE